MIEYIKEKICKCNCCVKAVRCESCRMIVSEILYEWTFCLLLYIIVDVAIVATIVLRSLNGLVVCCCCCGWMMKSVKERMKKVFGDKNEVNVIGLFDLSESVESKKN